MHALQPLVGDWTIEVPFASGSGTLSFEWLEGERFLIQRWTVPVPEAPDGIAIIGADGDAYVQHYFDSRGVHRTYGLSLEDGVLRLWRDGEDFSQRYSGTISDDGARIDGAWEIAEDGVTWGHDFDITYRRVA
jgi:hypothetical protein